MRISSRLALAGSVVVMVAAATGVALSMPGGADGPTGPVPELTASAEQQDAEPQSVAPQEAPHPATPEQAAPPATDPVESTSPVAQPLTGEQIAALAATPARERAATLIAEAEARAEREREDDDDDESQADKWDELRDEIREACDDGRIRGAICGDA